MTANLPSPLDNTSVAQTLFEIADLLELKGDKPFKIRAYRNAAEAVSSLDEAGLRGWSGIGRDLAEWIREITLTGDCAIHRELLTEFPATLLDVMRLQGVGPKTVAVLFWELGVTSLEGLATAARAGRLGGITGMGSRRAQLILQAIEERQRFAGRHLLSRATEMADAIVSHLEATRAERGYLDRRECSPWLGHKRRPRPPRHRKRRQSQGQTVLHRLQGA